MLTIHRFLLARRRAQRAILAALAGLLVAVLDYLTGWRLSFSAFYLLPVSIASWYLGARAGAFAGALSAAAWAVSNELAGQPFPLELEVWNAGVRLAFFLIVSFLLVRLRETLARLEASLARERELSRYDALTGVLNAKGFREVASLELQRAARYQRPVAVVFLDLDNFKDVNDERGHAAGDEVLRLVAERLVSSLRRSDTVARMGGDEFAVLLPETDRGSTELLLGKLRQRLREELATRGWPVTVSAGAVALVPNGVSLDWLLHEADRLMYGVKAGGKDGVVVVGV